MARSIFDTNRSVYFRAVRDGKPVIAARAMREAILAGTSEEVAAFVIEARQRAGVQDVAMLPDTTWTVRLQSQPAAEGVTMDDTNFRAILDGATDVRISWPSLYSHWGVSVSFTVNGQSKYVATSADWQHTETYLST